MKKLYLTAIFALVTVFLIFSQNNKGKIYSTSSGAIKGYDPVAYFTMDTAVKGEDDLIYQWKGADWHFVNEKNKDLFMENPEKYAPEYGGYCAYAMAEGKRVKIDPEAWSVVDEKLYLNYSRNIQDKWMKQMNEYITEADREWKELMPQ